MTAVKPNRNDLFVMLAIFLGAAIAIAATSLLLDYVLIQASGHPTRVFLISSLLTGAIGGGACVQMKLREREQLEHLKDRFRTLTEMNLNIRNALMVLTFYSVQIGDESGVTLVTEALKRIERTLDRVFSKWKLDDSVPEAQQHQVREAAYGGRYRRWRDKPA